jgi:hypothetical protein
MVDAEVLPFGLIENGVTAAPTCGRQNTADESKRQSRVPLRLAIEQLKQADSADASADEAAVQPDGACDLRAFVVGSKVGHGGSDSIPEFSQRVPPHARRIGSGKSDVVELTPAHHPEINRRFPRQPPLFDPGSQPPDRGMDASNPHLDDDWEPVQRRGGAVVVIRVH